jgi:hypothetical protein
MYSQQVSLIRNVVPEKFIIPMFEKIREKKNIVLLGKDCLGREFLSYIIDPFTKVYMMEDLHQYQYSPSDFIVECNIYDTYEKIAWSNWKLEEIEKRLSKPESRVLRSSKNSEKEKEKYISDIKDFLQKIESTHERSKKIAEVKKLFRYMLQYREFLYKPLYRKFLITIIQKIDTLLNEIENLNDPSENGFKKFLLKSRTTFTKIK